MPILIDTGSRLVCYHFPTLVCLLFKASEKYFKKLVYSFKLISRSATRERVGANFCNGPEAFISYLISFSSYPARGEFGQMASLPVELMS